MFRSGLVPRRFALFGIAAGIYLIAKGFRPNASLFERDRRESRADDFAFPLDENAAPARAEPAGA